MTLYTIGQIVTYDNKKWIIDSFTIDGNGQTQAIDKMREFHKLELGKGMGERSIFWTCSNCKLWVSLAHKFCPNCGAKMDEQALKERET